jgi:hypothetical protein
MFTKIDVACLTFTAAVLVFNRPINKIVAVGTERRTLKRLKRDFPESYAALKRMNLI